MFLVGLTGGIASGKSTVSSILKNNFNCIVVDADAIARQVVEPGTNAYNLIVKEFGDAILQDDGAINRGKLGEIIFSDDIKRRRLNAITHPAIGKAILWEIVKCFFSGHRFVILDIPLLFESKTWTRFTNLNVVVYCQSQIQLQRLINRNNLTEDNAKSRIASQLSLEEKRIRADVVIDNNGTLEETYKQVEMLYKSLKESKKYLVPRILFLAVISSLCAVSYNLITGL